MAFRNIPQEQSLHDKVITTAERKIAEKGVYKVYTNPGINKIAGIRDQYPDIILTPFDSNIVKIIIEVETEDSITTEESKQWKIYAGLGAPFYLLVPSASLPEAERICKEELIPAKFCDFTVDASGVITVSINCIDF